MGAMAITNPLTKSGSSSKGNKSMDPWLLGVLVWALMALAFCGLWWKWHGSSPSDTIHDRKEPTDIDPQSGDRD